MRKPELRGRSHSSSSANLFPLASSSSYLLLLLTVRLLPLEKGVCWFLFSDSSDSLEFTLTTHIDSYTKLLHTHTHKSPIFHSCFSPLFHGFSRARFSPRWREVVVAAAVAIQRISPEKSRSPRRLAGYCGMGLSRKDSSWARVDM